MSDSPFRSVYPLAQRETYQANELVDFTISFPGMQLVMNSLAITGRVRVVNQGNPVNPDAGVGRDEHVGHHAYFTNITTSSTTKGLIESFSNYPRYIKMHADTTMPSTGLGVQTATAMEGRVSCVQQVLGYQACSTDTASTESRFEPFCIKPRICEIGRAHV